jgi:TM2 domain-containing membrane protein YozV
MTPGAGPSHGAPAPPPGYGPPPPPGYAAPPPGYAPPPPSYGQPYPSPPYAGPYPPAGGYQGHAGYPGHHYPGYPPSYPGALAPPDARSRLAAGLFGIFLGGFGVHRFYLGYTAIGIVQIVVTVLTCGIGAVWGLVEGIMILANAESFRTDAHGRPLRE